MSDRLVSFFRRLEIWRKSRQPKRLLAALPAMVVAVMLGVALFYVIAWARVRRVDRYRAIATSAWTQNDYTTALLAFNRLAILDETHRDEHLFRKALCFDRLGKRDQAIQLLEHLAPLDRPGFPPAHLQLAAWLSTATNATPSASLRVIEQHLQNAFTAEPASIDVNLALAQFHLNLRAWGKAESHLRTVAPARPDVSLLLSFVLAAQGRDSGALAWAGIAERYFRAQTLLLKDRVPGPRINWANALASGRNYPQSVSVLEDGWKKTTNALYLPIMGKVYALWARSLPPSGPGMIPERLRLIQQGLQVAPRDQTLLSDLIAISRLDGPDAEKAAAEIRRLLAIGEGSAMLHFCLGLDAWKRKDFDTARQHFEFSYRQFPNMPVVANNMAWTLALSSRPDLPHALAIIQSLIDRFPDNPDFRETRGQILVRMGRMREGIEDLEYALPKVTQRESVHRAMAEAYRAIGMDAIAIEHERRMQIEQNIERASSLPMPAAGVTLEDLAPK